MTAINFPATPSNGDTHTVGTSTYTYNSAKGYWDAVPTGSSIDLALVENHIIPSINNTYDLGSASNKWNSLHVAGMPEITLGTGTTTLKLEVDASGKLQQTPTVSGTVGTQVQNVAFTDLSVTTASAGAAGLTYNNTSGTFTYTPPDLSGYATTSSVTALVDSAPGALNTLNELAAALGDDASFSTTVTNSLAGKSALPVVTVTVAGGLFLLDGTAQQTASLAKSSTYRFDQSDSSNASHPLRFSARSNGTHAGGVAYTTQVTEVGTPGSAGAYTQIVVEQDTPSTLYYKKESDSDLVACIGAQAYHICELTQSFYDAHPDISVLGSNYVAYVMETGAPGGQSLTTNTINGWTQGPLSLAACEECAESGAGGQSQEYNCNGDCKYLVSTLGDTFGTQLNLTYEHWQLNDCDQCVNVANALLGFLEDCCDEDPQGNPITDECGACINQIGPNQVKVTAVAGGGYTVEHSGGTITTDCSPCSILETGEDYNYESLQTALQMVQADECQGCDTDWLIKDSGPQLGYYYSANQLQYKCSCDSTPVSNTEQECCPGYFYDNCAYNGVGGCVASGTAPIEKECNGNCPTNGEYLYGPNECSECALLSEGNGLNAVGCCGNEQKGCDDVCYPAGEAPEELACGCNDATSCLGCTDTTASNFNPSATVDDGTCTYDVLETLYDTLDAVIINNDGAAAILEEAYFIGVSERNLTQINANKLITPSLNNTSGFETFIDQTYYTFKCQVISTSNPILYLENPEANAEVLYTAPSSGENQSNLAQVNSNMDIEIVAGSTASYTAIYYFRLSSDLNLKTYNTLTLFNSIGDKLERIRNANGETVMFDYDYNSFDLETGYNSNINPVTDTEPNSTLTANVYNVYSVTMKINPDTGQPYNKTLDFSDFIYEEIPGCMDQNAINFNPNANVIGEDCQYEEVGEGLTISITGENVIPEKLKWVIYDQSNNIIKYNLGNYSDAFETDSAYTLNIGSIKYSCLYFVPIGYKYEDAWQNVKLVISENGSVIHKILNYGIEAKNISLDNRGTIAIGGSSCTLGCGNTSFNELHTDYCVANVKKDSIEFTSIDFTLELNAYSSAVVVEVYNLDLGNTLLRFEEIDEISIEYKDSFTIDKNTRVGIRINNPDNVGLKYSMVSEFGEIILKKTIK